MLTYFRLSGDADDARHAPARAVRIFRAATRSMAQAHESSTFARE
jgi:hypothetical protein